MIVTHRRRQRAGVTQGCLRVAGLALGVALVMAASPAPAADLIRILDIEPTCGERGDVVLIHGFGFGASNVRVTVGGVPAQVTHATGHTVAFLVPETAPAGPTTVEATHKRGSQRGSIAFRTGCEGPAEVNVPDVPGLRHGEPCPHSRPCRWRLGRSPPRTAIACRLAASSASRSGPERRSRSGPLWTSSSLSGRRGRLRRSR